MLTIKDHRPGWWPRLNLRRCPYLLQNGAMGAYGPNTCRGGCVDEPVCVTAGPQYSCRGRKVTTRRPIKEKP